MATTKKNDATGEPHKIEFNGDTYIVPPAEDWDLDVLEALEDSQPTAAMRALLGDEQYKLFRASNKKVRDLNAFFAEASKKVGAGNS